jgi:two-component system, response regulator YesN
VFKALIVDDEPIIRKGLEKLLRESEELEVSVRTAASGIEALAEMRRDRPHFLFTDIRMPKMDGIELCRIVSEEFEDCLKVIVSGYDDFDYARQAMSYGVVDYLLKPVSKKNVAGVLRKLADRYHKQALQGIVYPTLSQLELWAEGLDKAVWSLNQQDLERLLTECRPWICPSGAPIKQISELLIQLHEGWKRKWNARDLYKYDRELDLEGCQSVDEAFAKFISELHNHIAVLRTKRRGQAKDPVEESKHYIEDHLAKEVSLDEVADVLGLNPSYFSQLFKNTTGETFIQYRIRRRMERAKKLLENPSYRITDISYEVGYADHPHFTKTFKKYTGYSPSEYRDMLGIT